MSTDLPPKKIDLFWLIQHLYGTLCWISLQFDFFCLTLNIDFDLYEHSIYHFDLYFIFKSCIITLECMY